MPKLRTPINALVRTREPDKVTVPRRKRLYLAEVHIRNIAYPKDGADMNAKKYVYFFGDGSAERKDPLGSKGANLAEMVNIGIPVPPGFTISTEACTYYYANDGRYPAGLDDEIDENLARLETSTGKWFGDAENPLLLSVRSAVAISVPGMMDTVLNIGLTDESVVGLAKRTGNERFAYDSYRRFVQMFGNVVLGVEHSNFEQILEEKKQSRGVAMDTELDAEDLKDLVSRYKKLVEKETGRTFPKDPREQLRTTIDAVFESWNTDRAITYKNLNNIPYDLGAGVNVQVMVSGNMGKYPMEAPENGAVAGMRTKIKEILDAMSETAEMFKRLTMEIMLILIFIVECFLFLIHIFRMVNI